MSAYYNEIDPYAAQWLRNLITWGLIAPGDVDERSIEDVRPNDLQGYTQCHFFAGIGGWSHALRLAGWPDDRPVWTGSCPCQPFSAAGAGGGFADERHLWPAWFHLLRECRPAVVFGEQVEAAIKHGWLDLVSSDLEGIGYAFAPVGIPAAGVGAPHIRQRLWFVADSDCHASRRYSGAVPTAQGQIIWGEESEADGPGAMRSVELSSLADRHRAGCEPRGTKLLNGERPALGDDTDRCGAVGKLGDTGNEGLAQREWFRGVSGRARGTGEGQAAERTSLHLDAWADAEWIPCRDGKWRPVEPGTFPLAHGVSNRVGRLRAYGNAIVPQVTAGVIRAYLDL